MENTLFCLELLICIVEYSVFNHEGNSFHAEQTFFTLEWQFSSQNGRFSCQKRESSSWKILQAPPLKKETTNQ